MPVIESAVIWRINDNWNYLKEKLDLKGKSEAFAKVKKKEQSLNQYLNLDPQSSWQRN